MPLNLTPEQNFEFNKLRRRWLDTVQPFEGYAPSNFLEPIPEFAPEHLAGARILPKREDIIPLLCNGGVVAEVGTQEGGFAKKLHVGLSPSELHLFDIDFAPFHAQQFLSSDANGVRLHEGDSSEMLGRLPDEYFDIIYIDGDHSYAGVKRDTEVAVRKLKKNGVLWFNDFTLWSPVEMIDYGVPYVVSELCHSGEWRIDMLALHPLFYNDIVLKRRN